MNPEAVGKVKAAIRDLASYVQTKEPGTRMCLARQEKSALARERRIDPLPVN